MKILMWMGYMSTHKNDKIINERIWEELGVVLALLRKR